MTIKPIQFWYVVVLAVMLLLQVSATQANKAEYHVVSDTQTQRDIPIHISYPQDASACSDFPADEGVLFTAEELKKFKGCIVPVADSKHNDMTDFGPDWLKNSLSNIIRGFVAGSCYGT